MAATTAGFLNAFLSSSVNIALPVIGGEFHISAMVLGWIPLAFNLTYAALLMPAGQLADLKGRTRVFLWGLIIMTFFSFASALAPSASWLIVLRLVQGVGVGMVFATTTALVTTAYPLEKRGRALGLQVTGVYLGLTLGPVLGGILTHNLGWRSIFWLSGGLGLFLCILAIRPMLIEKPMKAAGLHFDVTGSVLYGLAMPAFLVGTSLLPSLLGSLLIVAGVVGMAIFVWWEGRARSPMLPLGLFRHNRVFAFSNVASLINYAATFALTFLMSMYLEYNRGLSAQAAGLILVTGAFMQVVASPIAGRLVDRVSDRAVAAVGMALCVFALLGLAFLTETTPYWYIFVMLAILGTGFGFFAAPIMHAIMGSVGRPHVTVASAMVATVRLTGQNLSLGLTILVLVLLVGGHEISPGDYPQVLRSVQVSFLCFTVLCVLGLLALLASGKGRKKTTTPDGVNR